MHCRPIKKYFLSKICSLQSQNYSKKAYYNLLITYHQLSQTAIISSTNSSTIPIRPSGIREPPSRLRTEPSDQTSAEDHAMAASAALHTSITIHQSVTTASTLTTKGATI